MHRVLLSTGQGDLWLYNVHLPNPAGDNRETGRLGQLQRFRTDRRDAELQWLVGETATLDRPYVLAGDFNTAAGSYGYRQFASAWQDTFALAGRGFPQLLEYMIVPAPSSVTGPGGLRIVVNELAYSGPGSIARASRAIARAAGDGARRGSRR